jgi:hypothetical protein
MLCADWRCGGVKDLPLLVAFPIRCISSISPRFYFRRHAFYFLPLATILEFSPFFLNVRLESGLYISHEVAEWQYSSRNYNNVTKHFNDQETRQNG